MNINLQGENNLQKLELERQFSRLKQSYASLDSELGSIPGIHIKLWASWHASEISVLRWWKQEDIWSSVAGQLRNL